MKKITVMVPTYNEEDNVKLLVEAIEKEFSDNLENYDYNIMFIDNHSTDKTQQIIEDIAKKDKRVKAIFNAKNFGQFNSPFYGILQTDSDCTITMCADFQDPIEMIHKFVKEWENGYKIVIGIKTKSKESKIVYLARTFYYKLIKRFSTVEQIEHFTGFGLYDKAFVEVLRSLDDPLPYMRGIVSEIGYERKEIEYTQPKRKYGKTKNNIFSLYDAAMLGITSYTKGLLRISTILGFFTGIISFLIGLIYLIIKLCSWDSFSLGQAPILIGVFFIGSLQLFFIGFLGEYILNMNIRLMKRPLVVEERRVNFDEKDK